MFDPMFTYEYKGCLHVHTKYSDGGGTVAEVAAAARRAGLRFVAVNDHAHMTDSLHREEEGFYKGVFVMMDLEVGIRHHHYLAYDCRRMPRRDLTGGQEIIDEVKAAGGFGFLAHPFEKGMPLEGCVAYTWDDLDVKDFTGICIWNFSSRWKERIAGVASGLFFIAFKSGFLKGPDRRTMEFWDRSCAGRRVAAVGGSDAHHKRYGLGPFTIRPLTYNYLLGAITVHILSGDSFPEQPLEARRFICSALRHGNLFIANDRIAPSKGFRFYFEPEDGPRCLMGEEILFKPGKIHVQVPVEGEIRLFRNGVRITKVRGASLAERVETPGVYRVEVHRKTFFFGLRPWIFSNPVYLRAHQAGGQ